MKKLISLILCFLAIGCFINGCSSGGGKYSEEEIRSALEPLLEEAEKLNVIYFGEGLPLSGDKAEIEKFYASFESDLKTVNYHPVDKSCGYSSEEDIRNATLEVFTEDYSEYLFERAFAGFADVLGGDENKTTQTASYAMYLEQSGMLTARINLAEEAMELGREYDVGAMTIVRQGDGYAVVSVPSELSGKPLDVELRLVMTENGWRLDSPTY